MTATAHITAGYRNYARFAGRTPRAEYWTFAGFLLVGLILSFIVAPAVALIFVVVSFLPGLTAAVRRLHDVGRSGWWVLLPAIVVPVWALIWIASAAAAMAVRSDPLDNEVYFLTASLVMLVVVGLSALQLLQPSQPGPNAYGPNPLENAP